MWIRTTNGFDASPLLFAQRALWLAEALTDHHLAERWLVRGWWEWCWHSSSDFRAGLVIKGEPNDSKKRKKKKRGCLWSPALFHWRSRKMWLVYDLNYSHYVSGDKHLSLRRIVFSGGRWCSGGRLNQIEIKTLNHSTLKVCVIKHFNRW